MPRRLRDWPFARNIRLESVLTGFLSIPSLPRRTALSLSKARIEARRVLSLPNPTPAGQTSGPAALPAPGASQDTSMSGNEDPGLVTVHSSNSSLPAVASTVAPRVSILSRRYWNAYFAAVLQQTKGGRAVYSFYRRYLRGRWSWRYLDPGYWSSARLNETRLDLWKGIAQYIQEAETHGKDARELYMKRLENDRMNLNA